MPATMTAKQSNGIGGVPLTRASLDSLHALAVRFFELGKPLPEHVIVELALQRLYSEYCLFDSQVRDSDPQSVRLIKKNSRDVLAVRYREFGDVNPIPHPRKRSA